MNEENERKDRTMSEERYAIIFSSRTGNTRKLADMIRGALPDARCAYFGEAKSADPDAEMIYVGFWTDKGTADQACLELLGIQLGYFQVMADPVSTCVQLNLLSTPLQ